MKMLSLKGTEVKNFRTRDSNFSTWGMSSIICLFVTAVFIWAIFCLFRIFLKIGMADLISKLLALSTLFWNF